LTIIRTKDLLCWLDDTLQPSMFADYCPNGLQVQGRDRVKRMVTGVTASLALIDAAIDIGADAVLVHHGWFWRGEDPTVRGQRRARLARLLANDINLIAYHLPLDAHPVLGNNAQLARELEWVIDRDSQGAPVTTGANGLIWWGQPRDDCRLSTFSAQIAQKLRREPIVVGDPDQPCRRIAWCTGGAQGMFESAIEAGADVFITGEISEPCAHLARENGVAFISAGHHATERYGVLALGQALQTALDIPVQFIDIDNPA
jgi:dinuclear metal center YbgI/SA1388 family protein